MEASRAVVDRFPIKFQLEIKGKTIGKGKGTSGETVEGSNRRIPMLKLLHSWGGCDASV